MTDPKRRAAEAACDLVASGMRLGLGTGSTAALFVEALAGRNLDLVAVPTSEATRRQAASLGIRLATLEEEPELDLTIDGADEIDPALDLIKGGGGALLREKIVASSSQRMIVIADGSKHVPKLGRFPLPIEVVPFGLTATERAIVRLLDSLSMTGELHLRHAPDGAAYVTDGGHFILDAHLGRIDKPNVLASTLNNIPGVVEHGLFLGLATGAILATADGLVELGQL